MLSSTPVSCHLQSFRFGPEIAFVAATCVEVLKGEKKTLVGNGIPGEFSLRETLGIYPMYSQWEVVVAR